MEVFEEKGTEYSPAYVRNNLTDDLHDIFVVEKELFERSYDLIEMGNGQGMGR